MCKCGSRCKLAIVVVVLLSAWFISANPGCEDVVDQIVVPPAPIDPPSSPLDVFRRPWDSEAAADWLVAEPLAKMCANAYLNPNDAHEAFKCMGFSTVEPVIAGAAAAYVVHQDDVAIVAFRGTNDRRDWLVNLDVLSTAAAHGQVHRGFSVSYGTLKQNIAAALKKANAKHVWITGHSLGGALALVCAYDFLDSEDIRIAGLVTFGQPMVAKKSLAAHLDNLLVGRYAHYVNEADAVPRVPPLYSHCGSLVWFKDGGIKRSKPKRPLFGSSRPGHEATLDDDEFQPLSEAEFRQLQKDLQTKTTPDGQPLYEGDLPWIRDHGIDLYVERICRTAAPK